MREALKTLGFSGLFVVGCVISAFIAVAFTLGFAKDGPEGEQGPRGRPGAVGPRGFPGNSESGENAEADVINLEGQVRSLEYEIEEAANSASEAEGKAEEACLAAEFVC